MKITPVLIGLMTLLSYTSLSAQVERRVAIIGGGISGLTTAYELQTQGVPVKYEIFEGGERVGGRIRNVENVKGTGLYLNAGAELVDSNHDNLIKLVRDLDIDLQSRIIPGRPQGTQFFMSNKVYNSEEEFLAELFKKHGKKIQKLSTDQKNLADSRKGLVSGKFSAQELAMDKLTMEKYFEKIGVEGDLLSYLKTGIESEFGAPLDKLSALNLFDAYEFDPKKQTIHFLPSNDELYRIKGGTQQIIDKLSEKVGSKVKLEHQLISIESVDNKIYHLKFRTPEGIVTKTFDDVVMTLPLKAVQNVELNIKNFPEKMRKAIKEVSYAENSKLSLLFDQRVWNDLGHSGNGISHLGFQVWDSSLNQTDVKQGSLTAYMGHHKELKEIGPEKMSKKILAQLEQAYPGISKHYIGHHFETWPLSYSGAYRPGEMTKLEVDSKSIGNLHWAGETFGESKGYMNGAVQSAQKAVLSIGKKSSIQKSCIQTALKQLENLSISPATAFP